MYKPTTRSILATALCTSLLLAGCSTAPTRISEVQETPETLLERFQEPVSNGAVIEVVRPAMDLGSLCYDSILINGKRAARLASDSRASFNVAPGTYTITVGRDWEGSGSCGCAKKDFKKRTDSRTITVEAGKKYQVTYQKTLGKKSFFTYVTATGTLGAIGAGIGIDAGNTKWARITGGGIGSGVGMGVGGAIGASVVQDIFYHLYVDVEGLPIKDPEERYLGELLYIGQFNEKYLDLLKPGPNKATVNINHSVTGCMRVLVYDNEIINNLGLQTKGKIYVPEGLHALGVSYHVDPKRKTLGCPTSEKRFYKSLKSEVREYKAGHSYTLTFDHDPFGSTFEITEDK